MIEQIVLIKLKRIASEKQLDNLSRELRGLKDKIPGIIGVSSGRNISPEKKTQGYEYGFVVRFDSVKSRDDYLPHPEHQRVIRDYIAPIADDVLVFGIENSE